MCVVNKTENQVSYQGFNPDEAIKTTPWLCFYRNNASQEFYFTTSKHPLSIFLTSSHWYLISLFY